MNDFISNCKGMKREHLDHTVENKNENVSEPIVKKHKKTEKFDFGNYNRYYGYRNVEDKKDARLEVFNKNKEIFHNKDVLDIGCNIGHITYMIARDFSAKNVLGVDIDNSLIKIARKNLKYYNNNQLNNENLPVQENDNSLKFPNNVSFIHANYVLQHDDLLKLEESRFDAILCLSVTKWIQLNWGDDGLKRIFKRVFAQLRSGGIFVLEAQPWESYKKKKLSMKLRRNCREIKFYPRMFENYLLSEIGFASCRTPEVPVKASKGFQRPIKLFFKT